MSDDLKLNTSVAAEDVYSAATNDGVPQKKKSGCGCFAIGCIALIILIVLPFAGGGLYLASLDDEDLGGVLVTFMTHPEFSKGFRSAIEDSPKMTADQKKQVLKVYDQFVNNYDSLTAEQQKSIKKNIFVVAQKIITDSESFGKNPPKEFFDIISLLGAEDEFSTIKNDINKNLNQNTSNQNNTTNNNQQNQNTNQPVNKYDF
jgi:hypothetical protein